MLSEQPAGGAQGWPRCVGTIAAFAQEALRGKTQTYHRNIQLLRRYPMQNKKTFAFQLAAQQKTASKPWQLRVGVAVAGCTGINERGNSRLGVDRGMYC